MFECELLLMFSQSYFKLHLLIKILDLERNSRQSKMQ